MCGEESRLALMAAGMLEIPPRVRRRAGAWPFNVVGSGNTSACAEKRRLSGRKRRLVRKYLRVCGEELVSQPSMWPFSEIPPRVRRRVLGAFLRTVTVGNTSACAEKREGGEPMSREFHEIPPRVRRRDLTTQSVSRITGNTSACAEKSHSIFIVTPPPWKYLRVCGEECC